MSTSEPPPEFVPLWPISRGPLLRATLFARPMVTLPNGFHCLKVGRSLLYPIRFLTGLWPLELDRVKLGPNLLVQGMS